MWLDRLLAADPGPSRDRMRALCTQAALLIMHGVAAPAVDASREVLRLARRYDDPVFTCRGLQQLSVGLLYLGELTEAGRRLQELGTAAADLDPDAAEITFIAFTRAMGALLIDRDPVRAGEFFVSGADFCRAHGDRWALGIVQSMAVFAALQAGDIAKATAFAREAIAACQAIQDAHGAAAALNILAWAVAAAQDYPRAARLLGAADSHWRATGGSPVDTGPLRSAQEDVEAATRQALGALFDTEHRRGGELTLDAAIGYALGQESPAAQSPPQAAAAATTSPLTRRENEVAGLIVHGLTNRQIAARIVVSQRTAESHVENILTKLGFTSRAQIAAWYVAQPAPADGGHRQ